MSAFFPNYIVPVVTTQFYVPVLPNLLSSMFWESSAALLGELVLGLPCIYKGIIFLCQIQPFT